MDSRDRRGLRTGGGTARNPRVLVAVCVALVVAAGLLWGASAAAGEPALSGLALLALAGVAGVVATAGVLRRVVGGLLAAAGLVQAVLAAVAGPVLALPGAVVLLAAGVVALAWEPRLPRFGARYAAPGERRVERDPDRAAWQDLDEGRDPTIDPADAPPGDAGDDPGDGPRSAPV
ncbi:Trp biosynthesis-associated membrane protein [Pseudonocardia hierapolitana]|uniref:Trp biosynthesis-associated membrane protein n=1 Tax=Pseudonocardia hierapolitana TaxID=1128676 RepID=UPI0011BF3D84|nr:Trp biosynthesis-associated membrane protein [Pseudonocardia hierapolitana]